MPVAIHSAESCHGISLFFCLAFSSPFSLLLICILSCKVWNFTSNSKCHNSCSDKETIKNSKRKATGFMSLHNFYVVKQPLLMSIDLIAIAVIACLLQWQLLLVFCFFVVVRFPSKNQQTRATLHWSMIFSLSFVSFELLMLPIVLIN